MGSDWQPIVPSIVCSPESLRSVEGEELLDLRGLIESPFGPVDSYMICHAYDVSPVLHFRDFSDLVHKVL